MRLVSAELLKLRTTRLLLWLGLLILGLEVLVIALHVSQNSVSELAQARSQRDVVSIAAVSALISLILGIVASAGEFANGTIGHTFLVAPVRERVAAAKLVAAAFAGAVLALAACVFAWALAALSQQSSPGQRVIYQDVTIPAFFDSAVLNWTHRIHNHAGDFSENHYFRVEIRGMDNGLLAVAFHLFTEHFRTHLSRGSGGRRRCSKRDTHRISWAPKTGDVIAD